MVDGKNLPMHVLLERLQGNLPHDDWWCRCGSFTLLELGPACCRMLRLSLMLANLITLFLAAQ